MKNNSPITAVSGTEGTVQKSTSGYIVKIVLFSLLIIAMIAAMTVIMLNKNKEDKPNGEVIDTPVSDNAEEPDNKPGNASDETTTGSATSPSLKPAENNEGTKAIEAFLSGNFYMKCTSTSSDGEPLELALFNGDYQVNTEVDGLAVCVMFIGGKMYMANPKNNTYMEFTKELMKLMDMDPSEFAEITEGFDMSGAEFTDVQRIEEKVDGKDVVRYRYTGPGAMLDFIINADNKLEKIAVCDAGGNVTDAINVIEFSAEKPSDVLTLNGLKKSNMMSFFMSLVQ